MILFSGGGFAKRSLLLLFFNQPSALMTIAIDNGRHVDVYVFMLFDGCLDLARY